MEIKADNNNEQFPMVDENGNILGVISRGEAHNGSKKLHPVVHLHVFNSKGELYLQKRPEWKDIQPNKWDTAVGGHVSFGENTEMALKREAKEELGICDFEAENIGIYVFESDREKELVYAYKTTFDGLINANTKELETGRFWTPDEIVNCYGKNVFTPNFESEYKKFFGCKK